MSEKIEPAQEPEDFALRVMQTIARANFSAANKQAVEYGVGFTLEDVHGLRLISAGNEFFESLADRISALLPPEEK